MSKKLLKDLLEITQVVEIIKKWGLSINILKMARKNDSGVNAVNKNFWEDGRKKIYQKSKYTILNNGA